MGQHLPTNACSLSEPSAAEVAALVAFDEQLRQGVEVIALGSQVESTVLRDDLAGCLRRLERNWPRNQRSSAAEHVPAAIGRFEIERVLGQGSFGIVYLARDPMLQRKVALKVPRYHVMSNEALRERFRREGRASAALDHPHIVPIHELAETDAVCYIAFAYCEGPSLAEWLKSQTQPIAPRTAAHLIQQLAEAMHYSHGRGVLHRDLKPNNVLLFPAANSNEAGPLGFVPRIVDFGLARLAEEELEATGTSAVVGTPLYMAPEQAFGDSKEVGPAADVYSLGTILYELLSGRPPFSGKSPLEVMDRVRNVLPPPLRTERPDVPRDLETICLHCLEKRPEDRYTSAQELSDDLQRFIAGNEVQARPLSIWQQGLRLCQQPQRVREAGLVIMITHAVEIVSMILTLYMIHAGHVIERPASFSLSTWAPPACFIMFVGHAPLIFVGWMVMRRRLWAAWLSLLAGGAMVMLALFFIFGIIPTGITSWDEIPGFRIVYPMMTVLFLVQTTMSAIAVIALQHKPRSSVRLKSSGVRVEKSLVPSIK